MTTTERVVRDALSQGFQPEQASDFVQYLNENGFDLVPVTLIGSAGWNPSELWAYQAGVMWERHEKGSKTGILAGDL
jgi:hypothetical protein